MVISSFHIIILRFLNVTALPLALERIIITAQHANKSAQIQNLLQRNGGAALSFWCLCKNTSDICVCELFSMQICALTLQTKLHSGPERVIRKF